MTQSLGVFREMQNLETKTKVKVYDHIILKNFWEYYVTESGKKRVKKCVVYGHETELGLVDMEEIQPFINVRAEPETLNLIMPAPGWRWIKKAKAIESKEIVK